MNILIVDNGSKSLENLQNSLKIHAVQSIRFEEFDFGSTISKPTPDLVILSGGGQYEVINNELRFANEIEFIRSSPIPILGICLGSELIAHAFGATLEELDQKEVGPRTLTILESFNPLFDNNPPLQVFESHRWAITALSPELVALARTETGFEIIKHKTLKRLGFQFHPESATTTAGGKMLLENALKIMT